MLNRILRAARRLRPARPAAPAPSSEPVAPSSNGPAYEDRIAHEKETYRECLNVHELPKIAGYWHGKHLLPQLQHFGVTHPGGIFEVESLKRCTANPGTQSILSIGSGNCDLEVQLATFLKSRGVANFHLECLDLNPDMLKRGVALAESSGVSPHIQVTEGDFNAWQPAREYDIVIASQALHHVLNLEGLLDAVKSSLKPDGCFLVSDMIGRNGHMRWPEALEIVNEFWQELPHEYRYNHQLRRYEETFGNWDCSQEGFEGIRSQDILPLLVERFHFEAFSAFANIIDAFIDRSFGHNYNADAEWDRAFIDRVHERDQAEIEAGTIKPTHLMAVMRKHPCPDMVHLPPITPEFSIRRP